MDEQHHSPAERLLKAYEHMMERLKSGLEEAGEKAIPTLEQNLDRARDKAVELEELTREEADKIAMYLKRDMEDAGQYLADTGSEFRDWLRVDIELIEDRLLDMLAQVADKTRLEWLEFNYELREGPAYRTGEITGPGILRCVSCEKELHFHETGHIPPCPKCHGSEFRRPPATVK